MNFVGVRNSPIKDRMIALHSELRPLPPSQLAFDCIRHIDFLRHLENGMTEDAFPTTLYWKYNLLKGGSDSKALAKCRGLRELYASIKQNGFRADTAHGDVTTSGIRLDGSHRAAIAAVLGMTELTVRVHDADNTGPGAAALLEEAEVKRNAQSSAVGRIARLADDDRAIGTVAFVDARPAAVLSRLFSGQRWVPVAVVETSGGTLGEFDLDKLELTSE